LLQQRTDVSFLALILLRPERLAHAIIIEGEHLMFKFNQLSVVSIAELVLVCIALNLYVLKGHFHCMSEMSDGGTFYVGAQLLGTPQLYDIDANLYTQALHTDTRPNIGLIFCRLPFVALMFKPLSFLPYYPALAVWRLLCAGALVAVIFLFPGPRKLTATAISISLPALHALIFGQDLPFMLLYIAASLALLRRRADLAAGLVFSLCCTKFHFLVLIPIAILLYRRYRFLAGLCVGVVLELSISFVVQGPEWPLEYWRVLTMPKMNMVPLVMPNLLGLLSALPLTHFLTAAGTIVTICVMYFAARAVQSFELALSLCLVGGVIMSTHAYAHDCVLALPALLLLAPRSEYFASAALMILPISYFAVGAWLPVIGPALFLIPAICMLVRIALHVRSAITGDDQALRAAV
jgi:hypothetical protein